MRKEVALALALAALATVAHAHPPGWGVPYTNENNPGRISHIFCLEDSQGFVSGLAYKNDESGYKTFCSVPPGGWYSDSCNESNGCKSLVLGPNENIISVKACRGGRYGYTSVTFLTDAGVEWCCGSAGYEDTPDNYATFGRDYQQLRWSRDVSLTADRPGPGRPRPGPGGPRYGEAPMEDEAAVPQLPAGGVQQGVAGSQQKANQQKNNNKDQQHKDQQHKDQQQKQQTQGGVQGVQQGTAGSQQSKGGVQGIEQELGGPKKQPAAQNKQGAQQKKKQPAAQHKQGAQQQKEQPAAQHKQGAQQKKQPAAQHKQAAQHHDAQQKKQPAAQHKQAAAAKPLPNLPASSLAPPKGRSLLAEVEALPAATEHAADQPRVDEAAPEELEALMVLDTTALPGEHVEEEDAAGARTDAAAPAAPAAPVTAAALPEGAKPLVLPDGGESAGEYDLDGYLRQGKGFGWDSKCQVYEAPLRPPWARGGEAWYTGGLSSSRYGFLDGGAYTKSWRSYNAYLRSQRPDGREVRYFRDYETYRQQYDECSCDTGCSCGYDCDYYYRHVQPLSNFKVLCDRAGNVYDVFGIRWNSGYVPNQPLNCLPAQVVLTLEPGVTCADVDLGAIKGNLTEIFHFIEESFPDIIGSITADWGSLYCRDNKHGPSTVSVNILICAVPGLDIWDLKEKLAQLGIGEGTDLCPLTPAGYCTYPVIRASLTYRFKSFPRLQAMLVDHQFQRELSRYSLVAGAANPAKVSAAATSAARAAIAGGVQGVVQPTRQ